jgi:putative ABC transport system permease protein
MWRNYLRVFFRDLRRQKVSAGINVVGLALGLCVFLMIGLYVRDEYTWDSHWKNSERIVRLVNEASLPNEKVSFSNGWIMAVPLLRDFFPSEIEVAARVWPRGSQLRVGGEEFQNLLFLADRELFDIFDVDVVAGSLDDVFAAPNRIALSEEAAARFFGETPALGKDIVLEQPGMEEAHYEVTAIYRLPPGNGVFSRGPLDWQFDNFSRLDDSVVPEAERSGLFGGTRSYFLLRDGASLQDVNARLDQFVEQQVKAPLPIPEGGKVTDVFRYRLQPIRDIHFNPNTDEDGGFQTTVNGFGMIAVFVLAISLANFVILNLARSVERQREVGIRKVAGALSRALLVQFVCESLLLTGSALALALVLLELLLPVFATVMGTTLNPNLLQGSTWFTLLALILGIGAIGGLYPALVLSRQRPDRVLRPGGQSGTLGVQSLRKLLVGFQFVIATVLVIATLVLYLQLSYMRERDPGFDTENVVALGGLNRDGVSNQIDVLRNAVSALPGVEQVALASHAGSGLSGGIFKRKLRRGSSEESVALDQYGTGYDFFSIYGMQLLAGRFYDEALDGASQLALETPQNSKMTGLSRSGGRIIINASTSRALGFSSPSEAVGATIEDTITNADGVEQQEPVEIIGVVADNQFYSLRSPPRNEAYYLQTRASWYLAMKVDPDIMPTIAADLQRIWREVIGVGEAEVNFVENNVQQVFDRERREGQLLAGFSLLAVVVACLGLYGLVAFEARRRTKEIGIRNVLGGEFLNILALFLTQFGRPVVWANLVAWPLALWAMLRWLERFPYQIDRWWLVLVCLVAGLLVSFIVSLTVGATVFTAAGTRPVKALRYE